MWERSDAHANPCLGGVVLCPCGDTDGCIDSALAGVASESATATRNADLLAIRAFVQSKPGGFGLLNSTVKRHLGRWFESQGAVRSGERVRRVSSREHAVHRQGSSSSGERMSLSGLLSSSGGTSGTRESSSSSYLEVEGSRR
eukprot:m.136862 g.136862  ORF g.136862 m.136862 type:complete len:143 (-) comp11449_c0_seq2:503-931(-)